MLSKGMSGMTGVFMTAAELSRLGYIVTLTSRNTEAVDMLVSKSKDDFKPKLIQVKANQNGQKNWTLNMKAENLKADDLIYIFVNFSKKNPLPEFHIIPSKNLADIIFKGHREWIKTPGRKGIQHKDTAMRKFVDEDDTYRNRWDLLGL
jgi:hypothetical protein